MFSVHAQVKYKKSVWGVVKGFIEKNTWAGLEDFYTALLRALQSEYCIPPAKAKGRRPRRGVASSHQQRPIDEPENAKKVVFAKMTVPAAVSTRTLPLVNVAPIYDRVSVTVVVVMLVLVLLNVILYFKLWNLEQSVSRTTLSSVADTVPLMFDFHHSKFVIFFFYKFEIIFFRI